MPTDRFSTEHGAQPTIFEMGADRKFGPELAYLSYDMKDVAPRSTKAKADGSAVIYLKFTPPPDVTCIRGAESYHEKLHLDYLPVQPGTEPNHYDGVGLVGRLQRNWDIPLHVEKTFGLKGQWGYHTYTDKSIERFGGIRQSAKDQYEKAVKKPMIALTLAGLVGWTGVELYHRTWRSRRWWASGRQFGGLPGAWLIWMGWMWYKRETPGSFEAQARRYDEAQEFRKILAERKEGYADDWEAHKKAKGSGWWDNVPATVPAAV